MTVSTEEKLVGKCHVCEINVYDRGKLNKPFTYLGKQREGFPKEIAMPCGLNRQPEVMEALKKAGFVPDKDLKKDQHTRCPFETKTEQDRIDMQKAVGIFSGKNLWDGIA